MFVTLNLGTVDWTLFRIFRFGTHQSQSAAMLHIFAKHNNNIIFEMEHFLALPEKR